jgi:DNA-binding transcriptional LysR family regulator
VAAPMPVSLMYAHRKHLPKRCQAMMDWLADVLAAALQDGVTPQA